MAYSQGNMGNFFRETRGGVGKSGVLEHKCSNIYETRRDRGKVTIESLTNALSNGTIPDLLYGLLLAKIGGSPPHPKLQSLLSQERMKRRL